MALETPPRFSRGTTAERRGAPRPAGEDAVPRGLAVAAAVMLRLLIVLGGVALLALAAQKLLLVVLPFLIAVLLSTLLAPLAQRLERRRLPGSAAAALTVLAAVLVFAGLWALVIPPALSQGDELAVSVQKGLGQVADAIAPLGIDSRDLDRAVDQAVATARGEALPVAMLAAQWAGAIVLIVVLTFFLVRDGSGIWGWFVELFHEDRHAALHDIGGRAATVAGVAAVLVALVADGVLAAVAILAVILLVQQLEGNVLYPVLVGRRLRLHPIAILLALATGGVLAGVAGAFLAVPVLTVAAAILSHARERRAAASRSVVTT